MVGRLTIEEAFELYRLDFIVMKNQSSKTEENHLICKRSLISYTGNIFINDLTFQMVRDWKIDLNRTRSDATVRNYIIKLRVVLDYLSKRGFDVLDPGAIPVPQRTKTLPTYLTSAEVFQMITSCRSLRGKLVISILYGSGLRLSELIKLDYSSIKDDTFVVTGKGSKERICYLDPRTKFYLDQYLSARSDGSPALIISRNHTRCTATNLQLLVKTAARRAGLQQKVTPHTLRHSFATNFIKNNGGLLHLSKMMGHVSTQTTEVYVHLIDNDLKAQFDKFHSV